MAACLGDTPASNRAEGYKESVSAYRECRSCIVMPGELQTKVFPISSSKNVL